MKLSARVLDGRGLASTMRRDDIAELSELIQTPLLNGSLNLVATCPVWLDTGKSIFTRDNKHFYWSAKVNGTSVIANRWLNSCPAHIYEIFCKDHVRTTLKLNSGDAVTLEFSDDIVDRPASSSWKNVLAWNLMWRFREPSVYIDGINRAIAFSRPIHYWTRGAYQRVTPS